MLPCCAVKRTPCCMCCLPQRAVAIKLAPYCCCACRSALVFEPKIQAYVPCGKVSFAASKTCSCHAGASWKWCGHAVWRHAAAPLGVPWPPRNAWYETHQGHVNQVLSPPLSGLDQEEGVHAPAAAGRPGRPVRRLPLARCNLLRHAPGGVRLLHPGLRRQQNWPSLVGGDGSGIDKPNLWRAMALLPASPSLWLNPLQRLRACQAGGSFLITAELPSHTEGSLARADPCAAPFLASSSRC